MQVGLVFESFGAKVAIKSNQISILDAITQRLPPNSALFDITELPDSFSIFQAEPYPAEQYSLYSVFRQDQLLMQTDNLSFALDHLESQLHATVAEDSTTHLFVHAGVVGWRNGAIIIPGRSMSGKTSLVAALVKAGATYYSDEYAVFDKHGYVHPYPKSLSIRLETPDKKKLCHAAELGADTGDKPLPVTLIAALRYDQQADWKPKKLSSGQAVLKLFDNTIDAIRQPINAIEIFTAVTTKCLAIEGARPATEKVVLKLLELSETAMQQNFANFYHQEEVI